MKAVDIVQIINVAGPLLIELVELLLKWWGPGRTEDIVDAAFHLVSTQKEFEDEHGVKFSWEASAFPLQDAQLMGFIRGIVAAKAQALA